MCCVNGVIVERSVYRSDKTLSSWYAELSSPREILGEGTRIKVTNGLVHASFTGTL